MHRLSCSLVVLIGLIGPQVAKAEEGPGDALFNMDAYEKAQLFQEKYSASADIIDVIKNKVDETTIGKKAKNFFEAVEVLANPPENPYTEPEILNGIIRFALSLPRNIAFGATGVVLDGVEAYLGTLEWSSRFSGNIKDADTVGEINDGVKGFHDLHGELDDYLSGKINELGNYVQEVTERYEK